MFIRWIKRTNKRGTFQFCYLCQTERVEGKAKPENKTLAGLGSIALKPTQPEREVFWMQVKASLAKQDLSVAQRAKIEAAIAQLIPRGKNPHGDSDAPVEWYTPPEYVDMARLVLGEIDLDPASNDVAQAWIKAGTYYTAEQDGMIQPWFGRIWCNPPYGKTQPKGREAKDWLSKAITSYQSGDVDAAILLLNRTGAVWYRNLRKQVTAFCEVDERIAFLDATGKQQGSPRYHNDFLYLGQKADRFKEIFSEIGEVR